MTQSDDTIDRRCSICGRHKNDVKALFDTGRGILICDRCIKGLYKSLGADAGEAEALSEANASAGIADILSAHIPRWTRALLTRADLSTQTARCGSARTDGCSRRRRERRTKPLLRSVRCTGATYAHMRIINIKIFN